jgi:putative inorganic carbon (hco3(-)) transporter
MQKFTPVFAAPAQSPDPLASPQRQIVLAVAATLVIGLVWILDPLAPARREGLPLMLAAAGLGWMAAAYRPALISIVYLVLVYFKINEAASILAPIKHVISAGSALMIFCLMWHLCLARTVRLELRGPAAILVFFWLLLSYGISTAQDRTLAYEIWAEYSKLLLLACAVLVFIRTKEHVGMLAYGFAIGGSFIAAVTIWNSWTGVALVEGSRAVAGENTLSNPNDLSLILLIPLSLCVSLLLTRSLKWQRLLAAMAAAIILYAIILCQSRGAFLGLVALLAVVGNQHAKSKFLLVSIGLVLASGLYLAMDFSSRAYGGVTTFEDPSSVGRIYAWWAGINMANTYPLSGVGIGNFSHEFYRFSPAVWHEPLTAHSIWFLVLGEAGWLGLITFAVLTSTTLASGVLNMRALKANHAPAELQAIALGVQAGLVSFLVCGSFASYVYQWPFYVLLVLTAVLSRLARQDWSGDSVLDDSGRR